MENMRQFYEGDVKELVYKFFLYFSRFEFALKKSGFVCAGHRNSAQVDWNKFHQTYSSDYVIDTDEGDLLEHPPEVQVYIDQTISFSNLTFPNNSSNLKKLTLALRFMRNNLFHGGKYGGKDWDDKARLSFLLTHGIHSLERMVELNVDVKVHFYGSY
ncbi:MAG: hypothetical protein KZQ82_20385 [Candidatus Thiodiazotropha sp. (ex Lucinoma annulata)]|nr:hypothetical protein [Candidatus Thiodiazotropha sp. (ex Lucinoma annulata)]